jgi:hypothetical protein
MNRLDTEAINQRSPYDVHYENEQRQRYYIKAVEVKGDENRKEYIALIMQRSNSQLDEIISRFDSEIAMFNELKP